jgi:hypothetical protein
VKKLSQEELRAVRRGKAKLDAATQLVRAAAYDLIEGLGDARGSADTVSEALEELVDVADDLESFLKEQVGSY